MSLRESDEMLDQEVVNGGYGVMLTLLNLFEEKKSQSSMRDHGHSNGGRV